MKRLWIISTSVILAMLLSGCWDYERLRDRMIITGLAIAENDGGYRIGIEYMAFSGGSTSQQQEAAGQQTKVADQAFNHPSIEIPLHFVQSKILGDPFYANLHLLVIGKEQAKKGIGDVISHFIRDPDMRRTTEVVISEGDPIELLRMKGVESNFVSKYIESMILHTEHSGRVITADIGDISKAIHEEKDFFIPLVQQKGNKKETEVIGTAVFKGDQYAGELTTIESLLISYLSKKVDHASAYMSCPQSKKGSVSLDVVKNKPKLKPKIDGERLIIEGNVELEAYLSEYTCGDGKIKNKLPLKSLEKEFEQSFQKQIHNKIPELLSRTEADLLDLRSKLEKENPDQWKEISESFEAFLKNAEMKTTVDFEIKLKGAET
ncbi:MAG: Ger(x)C family spore germination protein [Bacillaceae bacterium]|nr:Ger(x)C family spore germination protein [Bacillaceae bacterium]